jgi:signal transduction histidine kinase
MRLDFVNRWRRSAIVLPLAALTALTALVINESAYRSAHQSLQSLSARGEARQNLQAVMRGLVDAETGERGYLLSGRDEYLTPYTVALGAVHDAHAWLDRHYRGDAVAGPRLEAIKTDSDTRLSELALALRLYKEGRHEAWREMLLSNIGMEKMERIRVNSAWLLQLESDRYDRERAGIIRTLTLSRIGVATMVALSLLALIMFLRQTALLDEAQRRHAGELQAERDHLEAEVAQRTDELTQLAENLQTAREDERGHIARELHDELGALLTAAKLEAARMKHSLARIGDAEIDERLAHLTRTLNDGIGMKRRIIEDLRPSSLSNLGLQTAIEILATEVGQRAGLAISTEIEPFELDEAAEITLYRMVQESLTNVVKYAAAKQVTIRLVREGNLIRASVEDDGRGFDTGQVRGSAQGLVGMRYRVQARGGRLQVQSAPGQGTTVSAVLPAHPPAGAT